MTLDARDIDYAPAGKPYPPIEDYAVIGDGRTAALISKDGAIEWLCFPHFSGPSVFAAILDRERGGHFSVRPRGRYTIERRYEPGTAILVTTFKTADGALELTDCMPIHPRPSDEPFQPQRELLRRVRCIEGSVDLEVQYEPRPEYATVRPHIRLRGRLGWSCTYRSKLLHLHTDVPLQLRSSDRVGGCLRLNRGEQRYLSLTFSENDIGVFIPLGDSAEQRLERTRRWWQQWSERCTQRGRHREIVQRAAITLKLLTYTLSGAIVAAATTSLPEQVGGIRNWDYRYCWLRDAALTLRAFMDLGYIDEGHAFLGWLLHATRQTAPELDVLYDIYGNIHIPEYTLDHLEGYKGSKPIRIGNGAWDQVQLDVYGEIMIAAYDYVQRGGTLDRYEKKILLGFGHEVCQQWSRPDKGLWEPRGAEEHHTHSKVMCWATLDRLIRLHRQGHMRVPVQRFEREMSQIRGAVEERGYDRALRSYVGIFDTDELDAALLLLPRYGFCEAGDPRFRGTVDAIDKHLTHGALVRRYRDGSDGMPPGEGAFGVCSFWAVDCLTRMGRNREAEKRFDALLDLANDVGLYSEEYDPKTGSALGNFPQAFTHIGLITAALSLTEADGEHHFRA